MSNDEQDYFAPKPGHFVWPGSDFHSRSLFYRARPAGYAALIESCGLGWPLPRRLAAVGERDPNIDRERWRILPPHLAPEPTLKGHLVFALGYEGLELGLLKRLFTKLGPQPFEIWLREQPAGTHARRIWFLYEWLMGERLDLPDAAAGGCVPVLDPRLQYGIPGKEVRRYRVRNNLPGTPAFCPLVARSEKLDAFIRRNLGQRLQEIIRSLPDDLPRRVARVISIMEVQASQALAGDSPQLYQIHRLAGTLAAALDGPLDLRLLLHLQASVLGESPPPEDLGLRRQDSFVGDDDPSLGPPAPRHVAARARDLPALLEGLFAWARGPARKMDAVIAAAVLAFGFLYIRPFPDGNGRLQRHLIHHMLAASGFTPPRFMLPASHVIAEELWRHDRVVATAARTLAGMRWKPIDQSRIRIDSDTADLYRFFDATPHAEYLYDCVAQAVERLVPEEATRIWRYDVFCRGVDRMIGMPELLMNRLFIMLQENSGRLPPDGQRGEFDKLTAEEARQVERIFAEARALPQFP